MSEKKNKLYLSIMGKEDAISIGKEVIKTLGVPAYVTFKVKDNYDSIIIFPCEKEDVMSFKVPEQFLKPHSHTHFRLYSKYYVREVLTSLGLATDKSHVFYGTYSSENNAVAFKIRNVEGSAVNGE